MKIEPRIILKLFLNFIDFEPQYSYELYSYEKKSVLMKSILRGNSLRAGALKLLIKKRRKFPIIFHKAVAPVSELNLWWWSSQIMPATRVESLNYLVRYIANRQQWYHLYRVSALFKRFHVSRVMMAGYLQDFYVIICKSFTSAVHHLFLLLFLWIFHSLMSWILMQTSTFSLHMLKMQQLRRNCLHVWSYVQRQL